MATRNEPMYIFDGGVKIYRPTKTTGKGKGTYFRIVGTINGVQRESTATTEEKAKQKAAHMAKEIMRGGDRRAELSINEYIDAYLDPEKRERVGRSWGKKHAKATENLLKLYVREPFGEVQCSEIDNDFYVPLLSKQRHGIMGIIFADVSALGLDGEFRKAGFKNHARFFLLV
jgi:hypothetical protein